MEFRVAMFLFTLSVNGASMISDMESSSVPCYDRLEKFAHAVSNYTLCAVKEATPFRFCCRCRHQYITSVRSGKNIYNYCKKDLILKEKHQIIGDMFAFVKNLWTRSNCHHCYTDKEGSLELTENVKSFFNTLDTVNRCFFNFTQIRPVIPVSNETNHTSATNFTGTTSVCEECREIYKSLQTNYDKVIKDADVTNGDAEGAICGDVSAAMNYTRIQWSSDFHCVTIYKDLVSVIALSCFFCFLPVIFYTGTWLNGASSGDKTKGRFLRISYDSD